jgi:hypothetical protein
MLSVKTSAMKTKRFLIHCFGLIASNRRCGNIPAAAGESELGLDPVFGEAGDSLTVIRMPA